MKILHTADWHIGNYPGPEQNGVNLRGKDVYDCLEFLIETAQAEQPDIIVVSGDITHSAKVWADRGLNETHRVVDIIRQLAEVSPICVMRGTPNHDGQEFFNMLNEVFKDNHQVSIFDSPDTKVITTKSGNINVAALPGFNRGVFRAKFPGLSKEEENHVFTEELGKIVLSLRAACDPAHPSILMSHYTVPGCSTESGQTQFLAQFEPVLSPEILDSANFDLVALGHIHKPQQVPSCKNTFYSGAINALNFNDEGQDRGFWLHELGKDEPEFKITPHRKFKTIRLNDEDVTTLNNGNAEIVASKAWLGDIEGKITRVLYSCTDETNKAFNRAVLEKLLYDDGAFWVQEITPEKITITASRHGLSEKDSPEDNLREYLMEKAIPDDRVVEILETARPIIDEASASSITTSLTGLFIPIEIEVKNYRNYAEETFSFEDVTFCTINGKNGVGKSSLFMDAILDCLYEEPREGELTGWIRNDEKARSGSIKFTFRIGDKVFRVTRTRTKSGKATLNLAEMVDGDWLDRSQGERMQQIQANIVNTLGMDSLTLKSCALIMQDQYGLFLQANKEDRMKILGNILGLGIYEVMENISKDYATEVNRQIRANKEHMDRLTSSLPDDEQINFDINSLTQTMAEDDALLKSITDDTDKLKLRLNSKLEAASRAEKLQEGINALVLRKDSTEQAVGVQEEIIKQASDILAQEGLIKKGIDRYNELLAKEKELITGKAMFDSLNADVVKIDADIKAIRTEIDKLEGERELLTKRKEPYQAKILSEDQLKVKHERLQTERHALAELERRSGEYISLSNELSEAEKVMSALKSQYDTGYSQRTTEYRALKQKASLLENSGCVDPTNAACKFLADARAARDRLEPYRAESQKWQAELKARMDKAHQTIDGLINKRNSLNFDQKEISSKRSLVATLEQSSKEYESIQGYKEQIKLFEERIAGIDDKLIDLQTQLDSLLVSQKDGEAKVAAMQDAAEDYGAVMIEIEASKHYLEDEKKLPVAKERKQAAEARLAELGQDLESIEAEVADKTKDLETEKETALGSAELKEQLDKMQASLKNIQDRIQNHSMQLGVLNEQLRNLEKSKLQIEELQNQTNDFAEKATIYEELKKAFSQDGVPHNIIRSIVPMLEATANNILGRMSGGKMSMEFVTEKVLKSNSKKEVVTLDIIIDEEGVGKLPYLSKSGGERVKSSLSAILALAEIKSSQAGIQLGMLFIDEPPFLDSDGIQAYCDALETIQERYSSLKVMAITHDPTMKARFPQSLDVIKTEEGSQVIFN